MKAFFATIITALLTLSLAAQEGFGPHATNATFSLQLGRAETFQNIQFVQKNASSYSIYSPFSTTTSSSYNSLVNMVGVETKYFITNQIAVRFNGMGMISNSPAQESVPGVENPDYPNSQPRYLIPEYSDVPSTSLIQAVGNLGVDYYFSTKSERVYPYLGLMASANYGQRKDFTLQEDDLGERVSEAYGFGGALVGGVDYYVAESFFIGFEIKPVNYLYSVANVFPQPGMEALDADNHTFSFLSNPIFKIGFKF